MPHEKRSGRSRRLRKKLFLDEFSTQGFELDLEFKQAKKDAEELDDFIGRFMDQAIEANDMIFYGSATGESLCGVTIHIGRYSSVTPEQRQQVIDWLNECDEVQNVAAGDLTDANDLL